MHQRGTVLSFLVVAVYASFVVVSPVLAVEPTAVSPQVADGVWRVEGPAIPGTRCGDWAVRLTNRQGRLSGVVWFRRARAPMRALVLQPDGSFSGTTRAGFIGSRFANAHKITGQFADDTVNLTLETDRCPPRHGTAARRAAGSEAARDTATAMLRNPE
jgi:hypothetical protein